MGRRSHERWAIRVAGCYRSPTGGDVFIPVADVSEYGCCFVNPSRNLFIGDAVIVYIDGLDPVEAEVRWHDRGIRAGFRFKRPLDKEQIELLVSHCGTRKKPVPEKWRDMEWTGERAL